jgi:hypothetical protein
MNKRRNLIDTIVALLIMAAYFGWVLYTLWNLN